MSKGINMDIERSILCLYAEGSSIDAISKNFGLEYIKVYRILKKFNMDTPLGEEWLGRVKRAGKDRRTFKDGVILHELYITQKKSMKEISIMYDVSPATVLYALRRYDIPTRSKAGTRLPIPSPFARDELYELYITDKLSLSKIITKFGLSVTQPIVSRWLREYDIPVRNYSEASVNMYDVDPTMRERCISGVRVKTGRASRVSLTYLIPFYKKLRGAGISKSDIRFGLGSNTELYINKKDGSGGFLLDFAILSEKILIEYRGRQFHPNFEKYNTQYLIKNYKSFCIDTPEKIVYSINKDKRKKETAEDLGYRIYYLWEESPDDILPILGDIFDDICRTHDNTKDPV